MPHGFTRRPTKFENEKNRLFYYPVLGVYRNSIAPDLNGGTFYDNESGATGVGPMFTVPPSTNDPNIIDGTDGSGNCCDLNLTPYVNNLLAEWNYRVGLLTQYSTRTCTLAGASNGCLLALTRFAKYRNIEMSIDKVPKFFRKNIDPQYVKRIPLTTRSSQKEINYREVYIPPNASLNSQFSTAYSSVSTITEQLKSFLSYFIVPTIVLEEGNVPTQQEVRVATYQGQILVLPTQEDQFVSRQIEIIAIARKAAPGTAGGDLDEMTSVLNKMANNNEGGFLGQALGQMVDGLIPGLGGMGAAIGSILPF